MSGAEALLVVGIIANIVQLVDFTSRAVGRVKDSAQDVHSIPKIFQDIQLTLPLLASTLSRTKDQANSGMIDEQTCKALQPVLEACEAKVTELKIIFIQALPAEDASRWTRGWQAVKTLGKDKKVDDIARSLSALRSTLIHYQVTNLVIRDGQHAISADLNGRRTASSTCFEQDDARQRELEERCLHSLAFPYMDSRRLGIEEPIEETCKWLFDHPVYQQWDSQNEASSSDSLLWIKGKPGSGKSTLMKRLVERTEERLRDGSTCISFFFSARGAGLERSVEGLYRSLTYQLLSKRRPLLAELALQASKKEVRYGRGNWTWHSKEIKKFFHASIAKAGYGPLGVFVDALDECKNDDVQEAVTAFERSATESIANGARLYICWSSRHYPHIRVKKPLVIFMEYQNSGDIATYVHKEVKANALIDEKLEKEIIEKANGVFMWVVLVFHRLLNAGDQGCSRAEKKQILEDLPSELDDLFQLILQSVEARHRHTRAMLFQFVMVAPQPLTVSELQCALGFGSGTPPKSIKTWLSSDSYLEPHKAFPNFVTRVSGGLLEISKTKFESLQWTNNDEWSVQFIHESVRDFLANSVNHEVFGLADGKEVVGQGHQNLRNACLAYLGVPEVSKSLHDLLIDREEPEYFDYILNDYQNQILGADAVRRSFVKYAIYFWGYHAREAERQGQSQSDLIRLTTEPRFRSVLSILTAPRSDYHALYLMPDDALGTKELLFWLSCTEGLVSCIRLLVQAGVDPYPENPKPKHAWRAAAESRRPEVVRELLHIHGTNKIPGYPFADDTYLHSNIWGSSLAIVSLLLEHGFDADTRDNEGQTPMQAVVSLEWRAHEGEERPAIIRTLAKNGADPNVRGPEGCSLLGLAVQWDAGDAIIASLIDAGADVKALDSHGRTAIHLAVLKLHRTAAIAFIKARLMVISLIIGAGADVNARDEEGNTALHLAVATELSIAETRTKHQKLEPENTEPPTIVAHDLLSFGADKTIKNNDGLTPADLIKSIPPVSTKWRLFFGALSQDECLDELRKEIQPKGFPSWGLRHGTG